MASAKEIEKRKAILRARGVPEKFIDNIAGRRGPATLVSIIVFMMLLSWIPFSLLVVIREDDLNAFVAPYFYPHAQPGLLFFPARDLGLLVIFGAFFTILALGILAVLPAALRATRRPVKPFPAFETFAATLRTIKPDETLEKISPDPRFAALDYLPDDAAFLEKTRPAKPKAQLGTLLVALAIVGLFAALQLGPAFDTKTVGLDAVTLQDLRGETTLPLNTAKFAYVICSDYPGSEAHFDYRIVFPQATISIWEWHDPIHGLDRAGVLDRIDQIDRHLARLNIPVYRPPLTSIPGHDRVSCIKALSRDWDLKSPDTLRRLVLG